MEFEGKTDEARKTKNHLLLVLFFKRKQDLIVLSLFFGLSYLSPRKVKRKLLSMVLTSAI